jgi:hypothetical protein
MAISPNVDFTSGQILTATQQNQFPRGIVAFGTNIVTDASITSEEVAVTSSSFTAVANRYYRITYFEPDIANGTNVTITKIRKASISGTILQTAYQGITSASDKDRTGVTIWVGTLTAGAQVVVGTILSSAGTAGAGRAADLMAFILVEDIGPA